MYGDKCACCGETEKAFLTMDHVQDDGYIDRKTKCQHTIFVEAIKEHNPEKYQTLCRNCNWGRRVNGGICPHKQNIKNEEGI